MFMVALPELLRVAVCAAVGVPRSWLPKARLVGESPSSGAVGVAAASVPVPERLTVCTLPQPQLQALSVMLTEAVRLPLAEGLNVTLMVQWARATTDLPQVLVCAKSLPFIPLTARLVILKAAVPVLVRVTVRAVLVVLTDWLPKARLVGERLTAGMPLPTKVTPCGLPRALSVMPKASAMQAMERITAFAFCRCTTLVPMGRYLPRTRVTNYGSSSCPPKVGRRVVLQY